MANRQRELIYTISILIGHALEAEREITKSEEDSLCRIYETLKAMGDAPNDVTGDPEPYLHYDGIGDHFGCCPVCGTNDGYLNVTSSHVFFCEEHKIAWNVGSNLFGNRRDENEEIWQRNEAKLADFKRIDCN